MKKYRYLEFTDNIARPNPVRKNGAIYIIGEVSDDLISELNLEKVSAYEGHVYYSTTILNMGLLGWELKFVTPCALNLRSGSYTSGPIENSYIFVKETVA